jgi:hypothetical protein
MQKVVGSNPISRFQESPARAGLSAFSRGAPAAGFRVWALRGAPRDRKPMGGTKLSIVTILIIVILVLLAIYLFQRIR